MTTGAQPSAASALDAAYARIEADGRAGVWIELLERDAARHAADGVDELAGSGAVLPLVGRTVAVKGNIDVAGLRTTAGCPTFGEVPARSAASVRALEAAGAVVVGTTNLDQFATGLVGTRSPFGICPNAHWPGLVSGGSSSGSAVAVASGTVDLALGTDTAGSGRVPAAANGIVGLKPTRGRVSTAGVVPACRSLDCVSIFAREVGLAAQAAAAATVGIDPDDPWSRAGEMLPIPGGWRVGVASIGVEDTDGDEAGVDRFAVAAKEVIAALGGRSLDVDVAPFVRAGHLLYDGVFVAERYEAVGAFVDAHPDEVDPVVGAIIRDAARHSAWEVFRDQNDLARMIAETSPVWDEIDVLVVPSVPRVPTIDEVLAEPISVNSMLGRFTNFVNLMDLCALTVPVGTGTAVHPPASVTLIAPAWGDDLVVAAGLRIEQRSIR